MPTLLELLPKPEDLLALEPEELAGLLIETLTPAMQATGVHFEAIEKPLYPLMWSAGQLAPGYPAEAIPAVRVALAEALSWLERQGLIVRSPGHPNGNWYLVSRRGRSLSSRSDVAAYNAAGTLPLHLLQTRLASKVRPLYMRGDYATAVFQAFKEVEVNVREASGFTNDMIGVSLMRAAFNVETGPLTDKSTLPAEREAMSSLFAGAIGHAKNPPSHREVTMDRQTAARLIVFASHLLDIVEIRGPLGG
jgi:uncharacterized protein (TIGR02391 family)